MAFNDERPQLFQIFTEKLGRHRRMACRHPVDIAAYCIDLAIVRDHAERMCQIPGRESVGGETLVYQRQGTGYARIFQVGEIFTDLVGQ